MSPYEIELLKKFVAENNVTEVSIDTRRQHSATPYRFDSHYGNQYEYRYFQEQEVNVVKMTIPEDALTKMVVTLDEFNNLMRDPETARLLMEARFISRLKHGSKI